MGMKLSKNIKHIYTKIRNSMGTVVKMRATDYLSYHWICSALGIPKMAKPDDHYSRVVFAIDSQEDSVSIISDLTASPSYVTPEEKCAELADFAISKGAKLLIAKKQYKDYPTLVVDNPFLAFCELTAALRREFSPKTVAITGSVGKTTTTQMIYSMLKQKYVTHRNRGSANNVRLSAYVVQRLKRKHEAYVQEVMEGPPIGSASTISRFLQPQCSVITKIGTSHIEEFGSQDTILECCLEIQDGMPEDGLLVLNADDPLQWNLRGLCSRKVVYYGIECKEADYRAINIHSESDGISFEVIYGSTLAPVKIHCLGRHNVLNALAAFAVGKWAGMCDEEIKEGLVNYRTSDIRQNLVCYGGYRMYLDCYNAAPDTVEVALNAFADIPVLEEGRRIAVLADVAEVGSNAEEYHRRIGRCAGSSCIDLLICYGNDARYIAEEARITGRFPVYYTNKLDELLDLIRDNITTADITLYKGSHSMKLEHVVDLIYGTWFHEPYERYDERHDFMKHVANDGFVSYHIYADHATAIQLVSETDHLELPDYVEEVPVTGIEVNTFKGNKVIKTLKLPSLLVNIREGSFSRVNGLTGIDIPPSVRLIDDNAFSGCKKLRHVHISEGCTHIGANAFSDCKNLETIEMPSSIRQINEDAFKNCGKLKVIAPKGSYAAEYGIKCGMQTSERIEP